MLTQLAEADEADLCMDMGLRILAGIRGVIFSAARSSIFLAMARVSTL